LILFAAQIPVFRMDSMEDEADNLSKDNFIGGLETLDYLGTLFLAVVAFRWSLLDKMPPLCILDNIFIFCYFDIFFQMLLQVSGIRKSIRAIPMISDILDPYALARFTLFAFVMTVFSNKIYNFVFKLTTGYWWSAEHEHKRSV
jgi:hypothetical protein